jgi:hypothetical protein
MVNAYELTLLNQLQTFWNDSVIANLNTLNDVIPDVFANLPSAGKYGANWDGIRQVITTLSTGNTSDDIKFFLQFPSMKAHIPCVTIEVGSEQEQEVVGSMVSDDFNQSNAKWETQKGGVFSKQYSVGIYSFNADTTLYLFSIMKYAIILLRDSLPLASNYAISARPLMVDDKKFSGDPVFFRYIDLLVEGLVDTVIERFGTVKGDIAVAIAVNSKLSR